MTSISASKYKTPLLFQILVTFFFLLFLVTAFSLITFRFWDAFYYGPYLLGKLTNRCSAVGISPQPVGN